MRKIFLLMATATLLLTGCKKQTFDERVQTEVENFNLKEAPKQLDPYTSFDSMRYDADLHTAWTEYGTVPVVSGKNTIRVKAKAPHPGVQNCFFGLDRVILLRSSVLSSRGSGQDSPSGSCRFPSG